MDQAIHPNISVDCVIFGYDFEKLNVLLVERTLLDDSGEKVVFSDLTLAGNHVFVNEDLKDAAHRILFDLTGIKNVYLEQLGAFGDPDRLRRENDQIWLKHLGYKPEDRVITVGFYALLNCEQVKIVLKDRNVNWYPLSEIGQLAYDHNRILEVALQALRNKIRTAHLAFELLPEKFTLSQLQKLMEVVLGKTLDKRNFRKRLLKLKSLVQLDEKQKGVAHKPGYLYAFSKEKYDLYDDQDTFSVIM
jgi:8-oxo-dGTP diphosphatase